MSTPRRGGVARWHAAAEWLVRGLAWTTVLAIVLIFVFIVREALPLAWDGDAPRLRDLVLPRQWPGYDAPVFVWQPVGAPPKYNLVPLFVGTFKVTVMTMAISGPTGLACAVYVAHHAPPRVREIVKPAIELLAGIPSVVLGFFGLVLIASFAHDAFGFTYRLNGFVAALAMSIAVLPVVFTVCEDALAAVPRELSEAALALGARRHQVVLRVSIPAAVPGIAAAMMLGFGRAIGETMVVLMCSGNAAVLRPFDWSASVRTVTATVAAELGEAPRGDPHWRVLFLIGVLLFVLTLALSALSQVLVARVRTRLEGTR